MNNLISFIAGLLLGIGLLLAGMSNPAKVLAFLDLAGQWDPSLALVMVGAIAVAAPGFAWVRRLDATVWGAALHLPTAKQLDRRLIAGSLLFGAGWGLAGICPGPALVLAAQGKAWSFLLAMFAGMLVFEFTRRRQP